MIVNNAPKDVQEYSWLKGANDTEENLIISYNTTSHSQQNGPMYSGRERVPPTGALLIATAAKSLQLCPTLCDPIDGRPPGSSVPGILQARTLEWVAIAFSDA